MNKSTVNLQGSELDIPKSTEEKRKLIKEIVHKEIKRKFVSVNSTAPAAKKKQSLLIPKRQIILLPLGATGQNNPGVVKPMASPKRQIFLLPEKGPKNLRDPEKLRSVICSPRTKIFPPPNFSVLKAKQQEAIKEEAIRKKRTKEDAERKKQEHREMVRGLFGKLDFLVCGGQG